MRVLYKILKKCFEVFKEWPGERDSNPRRCYPQRFSRPPLSTTQPSPDKRKTKVKKDNQKLVKQNLIKSLIKFGGDTRSRTEEWKLCRLLPYHLAMSPPANPYLKILCKTPKNLQKNLKNTKSLLVFLALLLRSFISKIFVFLLGFKGGGARSRT